MNIEIIKSNLDNLDYIIIDREDGSFTSMLKAVYEAQRVEHLTSPLSNEPAKDVL